MKSISNAPSGQVAPPGGQPGFSFHQARKSPCESCATSPCCTYLPLNTFSVNNMMELDHAIYLLNFEHIELGISAKGEWSAYYTSPCRYLDRETCGCTIHNQPEQPRICVHYNPYQCWYKRVLTKNHVDDWIRIDQGRLAKIIELLRFDEDENLTYIPPWATLQEIAAATPIKTINAAEVEVRKDYHLPVLNDGEIGRSLDQLGDPCDSCEAYCCKTLIFPQQIPSTSANLDYIKFCLGFPGIEISVGPLGWTLVVKTKCKHLDHNRCSIFGQVGRPLICKYYDAWKCTYRSQFGYPSNPDSVNISYEDFSAFAELFSFDAEGGIKQGPEGVKAIQQAIHRL